MNSSTGGGWGLQLTEWPQPKKAGGNFHAEVKKCSLVNLPLPDLVVSRVESSFSPPIPYETQCFKMPHVEKFL